MNCIILAVISCIAVINAQPLGLGLGLGLGGMGGGFANGGGFGGLGFESGANGIGDLGYQNSGVGGFHNIGDHNNRVLSVNQVENSGMHNIGGGSAINNGGFGSDGFNRYLNGGSRFGNGFGSGTQELFI